MTLGCDWFIKNGAQLHFDTQTLVLPNTKPLATIPLLNTPQFSTHILHTQIHLEPPQVQLAAIRSILWQFPDLFHKPTKTTKINLLVQHSIPTVNSKPIQTAPRRQSPLDNHRINQAVQDMLEKDIIESSSSDWISEPHLIRKDDVTFRFCIDFRPLNKIMKHDLYPLPRIHDLLGQDGKSSYFTSLDLASGYWQIPKQLFAHNMVYSNLKECHSFYSILEARSKEWQIQSFKTSSMRVWCWCTLMIS